MDKIVLNENGEEVIYDVLFTLKDEKKNLEYIFYTGDSDYIYAALYNNGEIKYIEDSKTREFIEQVVDIIKKEMVEQ